MFSFPELVRTIAREDPDHVVITDLVTDVTNAMLDRRSSQVANGLAAEGVGAGDRVVYVGRNSIDFFETLFATAKLGAVSAPLNWRLTPNEITALTRDAEATVAVVDPEFRAGIPDDVRVVLTGEQFARWREGQSDVDPGHVSGPDDVVVQSYTSGTTALPKGVLITNRNYGVAMAGTSPLLGIERGSVLLAAMPVFHVGGSVWGLFAPFNRGTLLLLGGFDPEQVLDLIESHRIATLNLAPVMISRLAEAQAAHTRDLSSLRSLVYGGQAITERALHRVQEHVTAPLVQLFGMTETTGAVVQLDATDHHGDHLRSTGRPYPWVEIGIFDPESNTEVATGERGELRIRSEQCSPGYWHRPEATAAMRTEGGWLRTGDIGHVDAEGFLYLTDRVNDMIITGGENVYPVEVEAALLRHPAVADVAVVGLPNDEWGEQVTAFVVRNADVAVDADEIVRWARERVAGFSRPREVVIVEELPRNAAGKVLRRALRDPHWAAVGRGVG